MKYKIEGKIEYYSNNESKKQKILSIMILKYFLFNNDKFTIFYKSTYLDYYIALC